MKYRCPVCKKEAEIDKERKIIRMVISWKEKFPQHPDCLLVEPIDKIDLEKLEKI